MLGALAVFRLLVRMRFELHLFFYSIQESRASLHASIQLSMPVDTKLALGCGTCTRRPDYSLGKTVDFKSGQ